MGIQILYSGRHEDAQWLHDNRYSYNLARTDEARQIIVLEPNPERESFPAVNSDGERLWIFAERVIGSEPDEKTKSSKQEIHHV